VSSFLNYYRIETEDMLVVHDEMDLPLGRLRLSRGGSAAGHRGVESIISQLGANDFARLRVGVGKPISKAGVVKHVLSRFDDEDMSLFSRIIEVCVKAIETWIDDGLEAAMNLYNGTHLQLNESEEGD
jgi:PTH1 family peptidyl-tRNA hydrolase